ncbi:hypothetical protein NS14008_09870 [Nocardia seriolae]|nr:hypothetical protein NS14008_09870 [Nocardia seriolae]
MSAPATAQSTVKYVAMGDSSAAGPLIPTQIDAQCLRSDHNWPHLVAAAIGAQLTDVTCSSATTADFSGKQFGAVAPQYQALSSDTNLVTVAVGANDIQMGSVVPSCINPAPAPSSTATYCKNFYVVNGVDQLRARVDTFAPTFGAVLDQIHKLAPAAKVVVTGYLTYYQAGGCWPKDPVWAADADYIQSTFDYLMQTLQQQALAHNATYADIRTPSAGHGVCAAVGTEWVDGVLVDQPTFFYHPTAQGMQGAARVIAPALG